MLQCRSQIAILVTYRDPFRSDRSILAILDGVHA